jgi:sugar phosphate isomerase/epimerase
MGELAGERDLTVVIENTPYFQKARDFWLMLESLDSPSVGVSWNLLSAAQAGETPFVSVPTLGSRIKNAQVADAILKSTPPSYARLGEGDLPVEAFVKRLLGIGYRGFITVDYSAGKLADADAPEQLLSSALTQLKKWTARPTPKKHAKAH